MNENDTGMVEETLRRRGKDLFKTLPRKEKGGE